MPQNINSYAEQDKDFILNWKAGFEFDLNKTGSLRDYTKLGGINTVTPNHEAIIQSTTFYNAGGTPHDEVTGNRYQFTIAGWRDKLDEGQQELFTAARLKATGNACIMYVKVTTETVIYEGLATVYGSFDRLGDAPNISPFELTVVYSGLPEIIDTPASEFAPAP